MKSYIFSLFVTLVILLEPSSIQAEKESLPVYLFTDFGGGGSTSRRSITDWQTASELASVAWKVVQQPTILIHDGASPLDPALAGAELAIAFPYRKGNGAQPLHTIVVHVIDPGVGNDSSSPRAIVWRKDGVLFVGPDNGTLSQACPPESIAAVWEIDAQRLAAITGTDLSAGGTFHGRDLFSLAAYLLAAEQVPIDDIATRYHQAVLRYRLPTASKAENPPLPLFEPLRADRLDLTASESPFADAFFLAIVQWPLYSSSTVPAKQLFLAKGSCDYIGVVNRKTGNLYIGPNNGVGTAIFAEFDPRDIWITSLLAHQRDRLVALDSTEEVYHQLLQLPPLQEEPIAIDLKAHICRSSADIQVYCGHIWIDAYGNLKTTLTNHQLNDAIAAGYTEISAELNGITRTLTLAESFADVEPGQAFIYAGSSGTIGPNPHRSLRYVEVSCNGIHGQFGAYLFTNEGEAPKSGQRIKFHFTKIGV